MESSEKLNPSRLAQKLPAPFHATSKFSRRLERQIKAENQIYFPPDEPFCQPAKNKICAPASHEGEKEKSDAATRHPGVCILFWLNLLSRTAPQLIPRTANPFSWQFSRFILAAGEPTLPCRLIKLHFSSVCFDFAKL